MGISSMGKKYLRQYMIVLDPPCYGLVALDASSPGLPAATCRCLLAPASPAGRLAPPRLRFIFVSTLDSFSSRNILEIRSWSAVSGKRSSALGESQASCLAWPNRILRCSKPFRSVQCLRVTSPPPALRLRQPFAASRTTGVWQCCSLVESVGPCAALASSSTVPCTLVLGLSWFIVVYQSLQARRLETTPTLSFSRRLPLPSPSSPPPPSSSSLRPRHSLLLSHPPRLFLPLPRHQSLSHPHLALVQNASKYSSLVQ